MATSKALAVAAVEAATAIAIAPAIKTENAVSPHNNNDNCYREYNNWQYS